MTSDRQPLWWLHEQSAAIRDRDWKLVSDKGGSWELYDLAHDRAEIRNVANQFPDITRQLADRWRQMTDEFRRHAEMFP